MKHAAFGALEYDNGDGVVVVVVMVMVEVWLLGGEQSTLSTTSAVDDGVAASCIIA